MASPHDPKERILKRGKRILDALQYGASSHDPKERILKPAGGGRGFGLGQKASPHDPKERILKLHSKGAMPSERAEPETGVSNLWYNPCMTMPILATKLYIPSPPPNLIPRPWLIERLNAGLHGKLTLVSAPAGFGKTTLVSEWVAACQSPVAWLALDEGDMDPRRFLTYMLAALQKATPHAGSAAWTMLQSPQPPQATSILAALLNEISASPDEHRLVLDDYHVADDPRVDELLVFLLQHMPPQLHLVITTREDPNLPLARLRARGQLTELRAADLRFTPEEAAAFLNQGMGLNLAPETIAALEARTEGWIAGLQLAALSLQGRSDAAAFVQAFTGSHRFVLDYLVEEVLHQQPKEVHAFLLQTAILDRLCGSLCDAVTGQEGGQEMLETLERGNLFVIPLDDERRWYRYHHLFAEVLRARAQEALPDQAPCLHRRASAWYAQHNLPALAIHHAMAAQDFERAAGLIELAWPAMDGRFQAAAWLAWARKLPEEVLRARPVLSVAYAWALLNGGELEGAAIRLEDADQWLKRRDGPQEGPPSAPFGMVVVDEEQLRGLPGSVAAARSYLALAVGDTPAAVAYAQQALDLLPEADPIVRGPAASLLGLAQWTNGELDAAYRSLAAAMEGFRLGGNLHFALSGTYGLADIKIAQGRLREAVRIYEQALRLAEEQPGMIRGTADLYLGLSELHREQGDTEVAERFLQQSEALGEQAALQDWPFRLRRAQARFAQDRGDLDGAVALLEEAERLYYPTPVPDTRPLAALKARVWIAQGRVAETLAWARERELSVDDDLSYLREFEHITLARVLLAQHLHTQEAAPLQQGIRLLGRLLHAAEEAGRMGSVIEISLAQALAHRARGDLPTALESLARALTLAEPEGYVRIFVDEGSPMAELLQAAAKAGLAPGYVRRLQAAFVPAEQAAPSQRGLLEPLSERELHVLRLLATELSGPEIARELVVSLNTMRTHTKNIYGKLGVNSRRAAVRRAQELELL